MLNYSKWFNASSRMLTTLDEALDTIIEKGTCRQISGKDRLT